MVVCRVHSHQPVEQMTISFAMQFDALRTTPSTHLRMTPILPFSAGTIKRFAFGCVIVWIAFCASISTILEGRRSYGGSQIFLDVDTPCVRYFTLQPLE